ncbi:hypothetical protein MUCCIDRAFT_105625 [Mucor lusitanicus CBS 277.49]|uniref:Uncharacterized protein n=1 Tax=Mucor lusitanicus CBS 277.49 TaxID=747725 RepID=A0A168Q3Z7_MUCCL|nr:hypothetical protein MUCCIDRAFT_105625 [Mucor lusitanicus CBS 277.49]
MLAVSSRTASIVLVPVTSFAGYATYVRSTAKPGQAHIGKSSAEWRKYNQGLVSHL